MTDAAAPHRSTLMKSATYAAVTVALILICMKIGAWLVTGSVAMLGSLVDSTLDAIASIINLIAVRHAIEPADDDHRFGHGKAEAIAGLGQGALIIGSALFLLAESARRFIEPAQVSQGGIGIGVIVVSIVLTLGLVAYQSYVVKRSDSLAITADSLHYKGDLLMNAGVITALVLTTFFGLWWADPVFGVFVALYVGWAAYQIVRGSYDQLMDKELPDDVREQIVREVFKQPDVRAFHDLKTRASGGHYIIQLHLELDPAQPLVRAHKAADEVEALLEGLFSSVEVIIHQDPEGVVPPDYPGRVTRADAEAGNMDAVVL